MPASLAVAAAFGLLYAVFLAWYGGRGKPLDADEIAHFMRALAERNQDPHGQEMLESVRALVSQDDGREFVMQNLVRYRPKALYPGGVDYGDDPRAADRRYARAILWPLLKRGNVLVFVARRAGQFIEPASADAWHYVAMVRYRSRRDFLRFALEVERGNITMHKWAAIEKTHVFPVHPLVSLVFVRGAVAALLTVLAVAAWALMR